MHTCFPHTIADLEPGDHLCCLYETEEEHRAVLTPFLRQGLERGEKAVYIVDARTAETILGYLRDEGLGVEPYLARGQLVILTRDDAYMRDGVFDPGRMIALLRAETDRALAEGYPALRVTGEMTWALRGLPGSERLIEYEARLNEFFPGSRCLAICQYDRRRFDPEVLLDVLRTHPIAIVGTEVYDNFYYTPPTELLGGDLPALTLSHWLENLDERKWAEEALRQYAERLKILHEVDRAILAAQSPQAIAQAVLRHIRQLVPSPRASVALFDLEAGEATVLAADVNGKTTVGAGVRITLETFGDIESLRQGKVHVVGDTLTLPQPSPLIQALQADRVRSYINVPLVAQGELIGCLNLGADSPGAFAPEQVDVARELADSLAVAIHQARLHQELQRHAAELEQHVAERVRVEAMLREYSERLEEMVEERTGELRDAQEELVRKERLAVLGELAGGVGHELRNPLGVISNAVYYLQTILPDADETTATAREYLELIASEVHNAAKIISDLLDFSRTRSPEREETAISELIAQVLQKQPPPEKVVVTTRIASDLPPVFVDPRQIGQVLVNLVTNAYQAMPEGGRLVIKTSEVSGKLPKSGRVAIAISDTGCGIPQENMEKVFEPLFTTKARGIGLGLVLSRNLVGANGGRIEVESEVGRGSTFTVWLPVGGRE